MSRIDELLVMLDNAKEQNDYDEINIITQELTVHELNDVINGWGCQYDETAEFNQMIENYHSGGISRRGNLKELDL